MRFMHHTKLVANFAGGNKHLEFQEFFSLKAPRGSRTFENVNIWRDCQTQTIEKTRMTKKNKICIVLINVALGLFAAYTCLLCIRETHITKTQDTIVCNITKLYQKSGRSHHPKAYIVYRNKEYVSDINLGDSLRTGYNTTTFYYDEMLDRVFCRNSGTERGMYVIVIIFLLSFLFWIPSGRKSKGEK